ncbi:uncharacterized protein LOC108909581 [Anoplophora glabripennis]|uniref:uncharacterized protein LOC108909581 n=1 Tax=Anoplophora glabripennis TaxID=217634 RepID=UPI0008744527|nr:uncharacterized protein LOC108909581 [Anoplophora glabripennis]
MFIYLLYTLLYVTLSKSEELLIKDSGVGFIDEDDIAMIFYVTLENRSVKDFEVSVCMGQCCDTTNPNVIDCNSTFLIGGDMGILNSKRTKNVTLIYPNLYLTDRQGQCIVNIRYRNDVLMRQKMTRINFNTNVPNEEGCECQSVDMDPTKNCRPVDCVIKYLGMRNYFDFKRMECTSVTKCISPPEQCVPEIGYSIALNSCTDLNTTIGKDDLHFLDSNKSELHQCTNCPPSNMICHHGSTDTNGQCECDTGWTTTTDEEMYSPTLLLYHMCNVEVGAWNCVNKRKIKTTTILIAVFAITIASKILILMCILNWCYKRYRQKKEQICSNKLDPDREEIILCEDMQELEECKCETSKQNSHFLQTQTVNVSYYPCLPSVFSSFRGSIASAECNKCSLNSEESIELSKTTSSLHDYTESESEAATVTEQEEGNDEEFSGEGEECSDLEETKSGEDLYGEDTRSDIEDCGGMCEEPCEQSDFTGYSTYASRRGSSSTKSKSMSAARKSRSSTNID